MGFLGIGDRSGYSWTTVADTIFREGIDLLMTTEKTVTERTTTTVASTHGTGYIHLVYNEEKNIIRGRFVGKPDKLGDLRKAFRDAVDELGL